VAIVSTSSSTDLLGSINLTAAREVQDEVYSPADVGVLPLSRAAELSGFLGEQLSTWEIKQFQVQSAAHRRRTRPPVDGAKVDDKLLGLGKDIQRLAVPTTSGQGTANVAQRACNGRRVVCGPRECERVMPTGDGIVIVSPPVQDERGHFDGQ